MLEPSQKTKKLRIIVLNSNPFLRKGWGNMTPNNDCGQLDWMDSELSLAEKNGQTVFILVHAGPVMDAFDDSELWGNQTQKQIFRDIIEKHNKNTPGLVQAILMGHVHKDEYRIIHASNTSAMVPVIVAPAISPVYDNNPGFRITYFDEEKVVNADKTKKSVITLRDYDQFYTDLRASYIKNETEWIHEYRFSKAYNQRTLQIDSYVALHNDLSTHSALMTSFMTRYAVHYSLNEKETLCAFNSNTIDDYNKCIQDWS